MLNDLVADVGATLAEFGPIDSHAAELVSGTSRELQNDLAERHVARAIRQAVSGTPYYRARLADRGLGSTTAGVSALETIGPTPKSALKADLSAFVWQGAQPALFASSTGTTGSPTSIWLSRYEMEVTTAFQAMSMMMSDGVRPEHVFVQCVPARSLAGTLFRGTIAMIGAGLIDMGIRDPATTVDLLASPIHLHGKSAKATHLNIVASHLAALVEHAERSGRKSDDFDIGTISVGGEIVTEALVERAGRVFGAEVIETYGATEILPIGGIGCEHKHLHIPSDQGYIEILDPGTGRPALPGAIGTITVTPFAHYRDTTRLLRYDTRDLVRVPSADEIRTCSLALLPAVSPIMGRLPVGAPIPRVTDREALELLQSEEELSLPTRYVLDNQDANHPILYVVADRAHRSLVARLEQRIADSNLPLHAIVLVEDRDELPEPCLLRADLREDSHVSKPKAGTVV